SQKVLVITAFKALWKMRQMLRWSTLRGIFHSIEKSLFKILKRDFFCLVVSEL
ncbi:MAG: hypothetical protein ACI9WL_001422, partial [Rubritalea sp.]